jgi:hypothetical protein
VQQISLVVLPKAVDQHRGMKIIEEMDHIGVVNLLAVD